MSKNPKRNTQRNKRQSAVPTLRPAPFDVPFGPAGRARRLGHAMVMPSGAASELGTGKTVLMPSHTAVAGAAAQRKTATYNVLRLTDAECAAMLRNATFRLSLKNRKP